MSKWKQKKAHQRAPLLKSQQQQRGSVREEKPEWAYAERAGRSRGGGSWFVKSKPKLKATKHRPTAARTAVSGGSTRQSPGQWPVTSHSPTGKKHTAAPKPKQYSTRIGTAAVKPTPRQPLTALRPEQGKIGKRLVVTIVIKNSGEVFESKLAKKLGFLYPFCCWGGVFDVSSGVPQYCACCCVRATEPQVTRRVAMKISDKLAAIGIVNEVQLIRSTTNSFRIIVRKMNTLVTKAARGILEKKLAEALLKQGVVFTMSVQREDVVMRKKTTDLMQHKQEQKAKKKKKKLKKKHAAARKW